MSDGENLDRLLIHAIEQPVRKIDERNDAHARTLGDFGRAVRELEKARLDGSKPRFERRARQRSVDGLIIVDRIEVRERAIGEADPHPERNFARTASTACSLAKRSLRASSSPRSMAASSCGEAR